MIYAARSDMTARYGERELIALTDRDDTGAINPVVLGRALDDAHAFIDGFLGRRYVLPLQGCAKPALPAGVVTYVSPPVLTRIACDLARYYMYTDLPDEHEVTRRHKAVVAELKALADGQTELVCPWGGSPGVALDAEAALDGQGSDVMHSFAPRQMNDNSLRGFA